MQDSLDDLPWPELGNVSRGATRGNQGQKGVLGPPDEEGRSIIQLRVQPGVLQVRLNRQSTQRYSLLANEVNRALKLTKTFWRKARRRQDYDARADQDHMELHEWLQQLKDKTMSHLELLMQKGDITGPPYNMPDDMELTFLRKFVERQNAGIPHNPRLRTGADSRPIIRNHIQSPTPEPTDNYYPPVANFSVERGREIASSSRTSISPMLRNFDGISPEGDVVQCARMTLMQAQKQTQEAFMRYTACLDAERQAQQHVDEIMSTIVTRPSGETSLSGRSSVIDEHPTSPSRFEKTPRLAPELIRPSRDWGDTPQNPYPGDPTGHFDHSLSAGRKHPRDWYLGNDLPGDQYANKRFHRPVSSYDVHDGSIPLQPHNLSLQAELR